MRSLHTQVEVSALSNTRRRSPFLRNSLLRGNYNECSPTDGTLENYATTKREQTYALEVHVLTARCICVYSQV